MSNLTIHDLKDTRELDREELATVAGGFLAGCVDFEPGNIYLAIQDGLEESGYYKLTNGE